MKFLRYLIFTTIALFAFSCDLELQEDPNAIALDKINPTLLLNKIQLDFAAAFNQASTFGMQTTRILNSGGSNYETMQTPTTYDGYWNNVYANILNDINTLLPIADEAGFTRHTGMAKVLQAYVLLNLVDYYGDVPFSQSFNGLQNPNPEADNMADLYEKALLILDDAIVDFNTTPSPSAPAVFDFYYSGNFGNWVRMANSVKLKAYLNLRLIDPTEAAAGINATIAQGGGFIETQAQNFVFRYATNAADPDSRHPRWTNNWLTGANDYIANYLMWQMNFGYNATHITTVNGVNQTATLGDPRMRFYFYRQRTANSGNPNEIRCILEQIPSHYPQLAGGSIISGAGGFPPAISNDPANAAWTRTFCFPTGSGYWGRDHVDPQGIPPDGLARTTWGAYPVGGRFDNGAGLPVTNAGTPTNSMRGAGFQPIMMRSFVDFMFAEAALYLGVVPPGANNLPRLRFESGIRSSMADVRTWAVTGTYGSNSFGPSPNQGSTIEAFLTTANYNAAVNSYVTSALSSYDAQANDNDRMNYIAREYWVALFGNGIEAHNMYRRTGMPTGMQPTVNPTPGVFPRSFWYPVVYEARNANADQKANLSGKVFWDNNTSNLDF